jgi:signal transduction histidine kinase
VRRFLPKSLAGQLIALILGVLVVVQLITVLLIADDRRNAIQTAFREQLLERTSSLVTLLDSAPASMHDLILASAGSRSLRFEISDEAAIGPNTGTEPGQMAAMLSNLIGDDREVRIGITLRDGETIPLPRPPPRDDEARRERDGRGDGSARDSWRREMRFFREFMDERSIIRVSVPLQPGDWLNVASYTPSPAGIRWVTIASTAASALGLVLVAFLMVRRIAQPLKALADASDRLGRGETTVPLAESGPEELRRTTRAFNTMRDRISRFVSDRTRMLAAMSHDLRTPLTAMRLRAEFVDDAETRDKLVEGIDEMTRMAEAALSFSRDEATADPARATDLAALVRAVADDFADLGHPVAVEGPARLEATVRPTVLGRALRNLIENAVRYGTRADIVLKRGDGLVEITVADTGPGIPEAQMAEVFEPFVRLDTSRNLDTGGVGLGLSIARSAVRAHGGELTLANRPEGGLIARIALPV